MIDLEKQDTLDLKIFIFVREEDHRLIGKTFLGYTMEDVVGFLAPHTWQPVGALPVKKVLEDIGYKETDKTIGKELSLMGFKSSLSMTADKFSEYLSTADVRSIKRIIEKLPAEV